MLLELFIFFELVMLGLFLTAFYTKQELLWAVTSLMSGVLMFTSYNIEFLVYEFNATIGGYVATTISYSYPYLMGINMLFFALALLLGFFDLFDKYGNKFTGKDPETP